MGVGVTHIKGTRALITTKPPTPCHANMTSGGSHRKMAVTIKSDKLDSIGVAKANNAMDDQEELRRMLEELRIEHRDLDDVIARLTEKAPFDQLQLQRLKKRKLGLKDAIARLEDDLNPDIIA